MATSTSFTESDAKIAAADARITALAAATDELWVVIGGCLVFLMQGGFTMLESGAVRAKNSQAIILKNIIDVCVGAVGWYTVGYALAFGEDNSSAEKTKFLGDPKKAYGGFIGTTGFFTQDVHLVDTHTEGGAGSTGNTPAFWFFQFTFCATCATIVSGALAERTKLEGFIIFNVIMTAFVYPIVVHWTWGYGWLAAMNYTDFAGSGIVHFCGGWAALIAAIAAGPRTGRFPSKTTQNAIDNPEARADLPEARRNSLAVALNLPPNRFQPNSVLSVVMGTFLLWFGWFGFNGASSLGVSGGGHITVGRVCVNTTLSGAVGGIVAVLMTKYTDENKKLDICSFTNGVLGGLVGITAGCNQMDTWAAVIIGALSGVFMVISTILLAKLKIDDPLGAYPVHGACGIWGTVATGLFGMDNGAWGNRNTHPDGNSMANTESRGCLWANIVGLLAIAGWVTVTIGPTFFVLKKAGLLRVSLEVEKAGVDIEFVTYNADLVSRDRTEDEKQQA